ncbi:hypothetical protein A2U01_0042440, partial [Trifolium medium]|nr:hypothetical protein [Trifolium medium]
VVKPPENKREVRTVSGLGGGEAAGIAAGGEEEERTRERK